MVTIQIITQGQGQIFSSGGDNARAVRSSITVPTGYKVYFEAVPAQGQTFQKWTSADGHESTQNPIELVANVNGTMTGVFSGSGGATNSMTLILVAAIGIVALILLSKRR